MSLVSIYRSNNNYNHDDICSRIPEPSALCIEEIRIQSYSCYTCGVCWLEDQVCLDCEECGGYAMQRPCLQCNGSCGATWQRNLHSSHASGKARWNGKCRLKNPEPL